MESQDISIQVKSEAGFNRWAEIEGAKLTPTDIEVLNCIIGDAHGNHTSSSYALPSCGNDGYFTIFRTSNVIKECGLSKIEMTTPTKTGGKVKKTELKKIDILREKNSQNTLKKEHEEMLKLWGKKVVNYGTIVNSTTVVEVAVLHLIFIMNQHVKNIKTTKKIDNLVEIYEMIFGVGKIIIKLKNTPFRDFKTGIHSSYNKTLIDDLIFKHTELVKYSKFDIAIASHQYPHLLLKTNLDKLFSSSIINTYDTQKQLLNDLRNSLRTDSGLLCNLTALPGEGKTTLVIGIAEVCKTFNKKIIFCCNDKAVTISNQVGSNAYAMNIPFALVIPKKNGEGKLVPDIKKNWICKKMKKEPLIYIAGIQSTILLLQQKAHEYVLFYDEVPIGLDQSNTSMVQYLATILSYMPKFTILSGATIPKQSEIPLLADSFLHRYPDAVNLPINNFTTKIACTLSDYTGRIYLPHVEGNTYVSFSRALIRIKEELLLQKFYNIEIVNGMNVLLINLSEKYGFPLDDIPTMAVYTSEYANMNTNAFVNLAMLYLEKIKNVGEHNEQIIIDFCNHKFNTSPLVPNRFTSRHCPLENQTLIVTDDPLEYFDSYFTEFINKTHNSIGNKNLQFSSIFNTYLKEMELYNNQVQKLEKNIDNSKELSIKISELVKPTIKIPSTFMLGLHSKNKQQRNAFALESIDWNTIIAEDKHIMALILGIGIYNPDVCSKSYTALVLKFAQGGNLAFMISNKNIIYGTNYPFENIVIDDCMTSNSVKSLFQLFARSGRVGKSWKSCIYATSAILNMLNNYIYNDSYVDIEVINFNKALHESVFIKMCDDKFAKASENQKQYRIEKALEKKLKAEKLEQEMDKKKLEIQRLEQLNKYKPIEQAKSEVYSWKRKSY